MQNKVLQYLMEVRHRRTKPGPPRPSRTAPNSRNTRVEKRHMQAESRRNRE
jgi:hypothetical protein